MARVLVTGSDGQLGMCIREIQSQYPDISFHFTNKNKLDITKKRELNSFFSSNKINWCINCAAYTNVDKAEEEPDSASLINKKGAEILAEVTNTQNVTLIHVSTDFVFDGKQKNPYTENERTNPINIYGKTKLDGEKSIVKLNQNHFIIRTSWLYSSNKKNFVKAMIELMKKNKQINVVNDQFGSPTYAYDLANSIIKIIKNFNWHPGVYHYSNIGKISWLEFAQSIKELYGLRSKIIGVSSEEFQTIAKRPKYSYLDKSKIKKIYNIEIPYYTESLKNCIEILKHQS